MKKIIVTIFALFAALSFVWAVPADPTPYKYTQPDGTVIFLQNHGDEFFNWTTDLKGTVMERGADGFYRPATGSLAAMAAQGAERRRAANEARRNPQLRGIWSSYDDHPATNLGSPRILCVLVEFADESSVFTVGTQEHFTNMLNQEGYSYNDAIGSVRDYYIDNSGGQYSPTFDVFGPVKVSQTKAYCSDVANGHRSSKIREAIFEAIQALLDNGTIADLSQYDNDNDGTLDMVLCYYPGHNPAEGGDADNVWPHQSSLSGAIAGKNLGKYFCTSELRGNDECEEAAAIGTTCHEFAHSLGLPDFYDTDYGTNGSAPWTTDVFDLMSSGNYNDNGRRPPYLSVMEKNMLGWSPYPAVISNPGNYVLNAVQTGNASKNEGFRIDTSNEGEYFIFECRNGYKWDSVLPTGLLVYHVDKSQNIVVGGYTASYLWEETNSINAFGSHPCYRLIPTTASPASYSQFVFPGYNEVRVYQPVTWDGNSLGAIFSNITYDGTKVTFNTALTTNRTVFGVVKDTDGNPLKDVQVSLTSSTTPFAAAPSLVDGSVITTTDADGYYTLEIESSESAYQILSFQKNGYVSLSLNVTIESLYTREDATLFRQGEGPSAEMSKIDPSLASIYNGGLGSGSIAAGMMYTADEIAAEGLSGALIKFIRFAENANQGESVYIVIDFGDERVLCKDITAQYTSNVWNTVDISGENLTIPAGKDVYIGIGLENIPELSEYYPFYGFGLASYNGGGCYVLHDFKNPDSSWMATDFGTDTYLHFCVVAGVSKAAAVTFSTLGVSYIQEEGGVPTLKLAAGKSVKSVTWYLDGVSEGDTPTAIASLAAGSHTYMVRIVYYDGSAERVYYDVDKK